MKWFTVIFTWGKERKLDWHSVRAHDSREAVHKVCDPHPSFKHAFVVPGRHRGI